MGGVWGGEVLIGASGVVEGGKIRYSEREVTMPDEKDVQEKPENKSKGISPGAAVFIFFLSLLYPAYKVGLKVYYNDLPYPYASIGGYLVGLVLFAVYLFWQVRKGR